MTAANFAPSLALVLKSEGGFSNNPKDPGGATMRGITQRVYDAYRLEQGEARGPVQFISTADLTAIYKRQYWDAIQGDSLPAGVDYATFDEAVNSGPVPAIKDLQGALGVKADGVLGMLTMRAVTASNDNEALVNRICDLRLNLLHRLSTWRFFGTGWRNRVAFVRAGADHMAAVGTIAAPLAKAA